MALPSAVTAGDTIRWAEPSIPAEATAARVYMRANAVGAALDLEGVLEGSDWCFTVPSEASAVMVPGRWHVQVVATVDTYQTTTWRGVLVVQPSLAFTGEADAFDPRGPAERELADVRAAINAVYQAQEYTIGTAAGGRRVRRADLEWLLEREKVLVARAARESGQAHVRRRHQTRFTA